MFEKINNLLSGKNIYTEKNKTFKLLKEVTTFHYKNCKDYKRFVDSSIYNINNLKKIKDIPLLPTIMFKEKLLFSLNKKKLFKEINSSSTSSGQPSRMALDRDTSITQSKSFTKILLNRVGNIKRKLIIFDEPNCINSNNKINARSSTIKSLLFLSNDHQIVLNKNFELNLKKFNSVIENSKKNNEPVIIFGFTYLLYMTLSKHLNKSITLPKNSIVIHIGGWKKLENEKVDNEKLLKDFSRIFSIKSKDIIDIYGFTEQAGIIFPTCEYGKRHVPAWSDVVSKNKNNLKDNKDGEIGLMAFYSPIQMSYPGHAVLTEDLGFTEKNNCKCKRKGKIFKIVGRAPNSEIRGCSDILAEKL